MVYRTIILLTLSNVFMTFAWYGHLKNLKDRPLWIAILVSWGIALLEYCLQVPANRVGSNYYTLVQLKVIQEILTMVVFALFAALYMHVHLTRNLLWAGLCLVGAAFFIFRDGR
ncbi:MAG: DMT family protein [Oligoflexia bacterium]|nr:DMT family protein [Oligoflexia bacterium]